MSEARAFILVFAGLMLLTCATAILLSVTNANGIVFGLVAVFLAAFGGFAPSCVVMRYAKLEERKKREEIILSR